MLTNRTPQDAGSGVDGTAQLAELLVRTARRLHRSTQPAFGAIGLTNAQARVVRHLEHSDRPVRMADIAAALEVVPRTATSVVDDLEEGGLVVRAIDPNDRRSLLVSLTPAGRKLLEGLTEARRRTANSLFSPLSGMEKAELARLLGALCEPGDSDCSGRCQPPPGRSAPRASGRAAERASQIDEGVVR
jgi:DNA-binding MarR family transcriptional regulator